ncbi:MAG: glycosyltransferase family 4 protein, partial [Paracoccaceae bacterium]
GLGLPYVIGPLGGSLSTPKAWKREVRGGAFYTRLRALDRPRLAWDPRLRASFGDADLILGVAPYIQDTLSGAGIGLRRFEAVPERGHDGQLPKIKRAGEVGKLQLLHVGRVVRTKALRDMVRAMALLRDLPGVRLISAGDGEDLAACKAEAAALGVAQRIDFLGQVARDEVERLYASSDIFAFPSFREPMGGVFFEAMAYGLPVITAARGGPDFIIDDSCGIRIPVNTPDQFANDIAAAIRRLADDPKLRLKLGRGAQARLAGFGDWSEKARDLIGLYRAAIRARKAR